MSTPTEPLYTLNNTFTITRFYSPLDKYCISWQLPNVPLGANDKTIRICILNHDIDSTEGFKVITEDINQDYFSLTPYLIFGQSYKIFTTCIINGVAYESNKVQLLESHWPFPAPIITHDETSPEYAIINWTNINEDQSDIASVSIIAENFENVEEALYQGETDYSSLNFSKDEFTRTKFRLCMVSARTINFGEEAVALSEVSNTLIIDLEDFPNKPRNLNVMYTKDANNKVYHHVSWTAPIPKFNKTISGYIVGVKNLGESKEAKINVGNVLSFDYELNNGGEPDMNGVEINYDTYGENIQYTVCAYYEKDGNLTPSNLADAPVLPSKDTLKLIKFNVVPPYIFTVDQVNAGVKQFNYSISRLILNDTGRPYSEAKYVIQDSKGLVQSDTIAYIDNNLHSFTYVTEDNYETVYGMLVECITQVDADGEEDDLLSNTIPNLYSPYGDLFKRVIYPSASVLTPTLSINSGVFDEGVETVTVNVTLDPKTLNYDDGTPVNVNYTFDEGSTFTAFRDVSGNILDITKAYNFNSGTTTLTNWNMPPDTINTFVTFNGEFPASKRISDSTYFNSILGSNLPPDGGNNPAQYGTDSGVIANIDTAITIITSNGNGNSGEVLLIWRCAGVLDGQSVSVDGTVQELTIEQVGPEEDGTFTTTLTNLSDYTDYSVIIFNSYTPSVENGLTQTSSASTTVQSFNKNLVITNPQKLLIEGGIRFSCDIEIDSDTTEDDVSVLITLVSKTVTSTTPTIGSATITSDSSIVHVVADITDMTINSQYSFLVTPKRLFNGESFDSSNVLQLNSCFSRAIPSNHTVSLVMLDNCNVDVKVEVDKIEGLTPSCDIKRNVYAVSATSIDDFLGNEKSLPPEQTETSVKYTFTATDNKSSSSDKFLPGFVSGYTTIVSYSDLENELDCLTTIFEQIADIIQNIVSRDFSSPIRENTNESKRISFINLFDSCGLSLVLNGTTLTASIEVNGALPSSIVLIKSDNVNKLQVSTYESSDFTSSTDNSSTSSNGQLLTLTIENCPAETKGLLIVANDGGVQIARTNSTITVEGTNQLGLSNDNKVPTTI